MKTYGELVELYGTTSAEMKAKKRNVEQEIYSLKSDPRRRGNNNNNEGGGKNTTSSEKSHGGGNKMRNVGDRYFGTDMNEDDEESGGPGHIPGAAVEGTDRNLNLYKTPYPDLLAKLKGMMEALNKKRAESGPMGSMDGTGRKRPRAESEEEKDGDGDQQSLQQSSDAAKKKRKMVIIDV